MRRRIIILLLLGFPFFAKADHITGGQMFYRYTSSTNGNDNYNVSLKLYMRYNSGRQFPNPFYLSVFDKLTFAHVSDITTALVSQETITISDNNPCITNPPNVCYVVGYYNFNVSVPASVNGYTVTAQINYRIAGINNLVIGYSQIGATYTTEFPGTASLPDANHNSSAQFTGSDLVVVCANNNFTYSFAATDPDGDQLRYSFCNAWLTNGGGGRGNEGATPSPPPYIAVPYGNSFSGSSPLGKNVKIDPVTGVISGIAPKEGVYVVTVCVEEIRNGVVIATQRKDLQIAIADCNIAAASLLPDYELCGDTKTLNISNQSSSPLISTYSWEFFNSQGQSLFSSTNATTSYTFPDTGTYKVKLVINKGGPCSDSTISPALVYPGFKPSFNFDGVCIGKPTVFTDASTSVYGTVNSWDWDLGDNVSSSDNSQAQNVTYTYPGTGIKNVELTATDTKGCRTTIVKPVDIIDKPPILLAFKDTLICLTDNVPLIASGSGVFSWLPADNIINPNTANPTVSPTATTTYFVHLDEDGCVNDDSVKVNVVDHVSLVAMNDTTICQGDAIQLRETSNGLQYTWTPAAQLDNPAAAFPIANTNSSTEYHVTAVIGSCSVSDRVTVFTVAYPLSKAGDDTPICYNTSIQLHASTDGSSFNWSPPESLSDATVLDPIATPPNTTSYILYSYDTKGCPKPGIDTIVITVLPDITAFAGRDTAVVIGQPLQLKATGGITYSWFPSTGLSAYDIADPIGIYNSASAGIQYKVYVYNEANCIDSAFINVKVYSALPTVFVPSAFTPNSDGKNDKLRPIAVGIKDIGYFNVYNRWGQLVFSTRTNGDGWDGTISGKPAQTGTFVWVVKATDYNGAPYFQKGITTLIR